jgi:hypothetical protein
MSPERNDQLEEFIRRAVDGLPSRRAPRSLEQRVLAEIERRAALPWWRKSFVHWPIAAQAAFLTICATLVAISLMSRVWVIAGFHPVQLKTVFAPSFAWMESGLVVVHAITGVFEIMARNIPPLWLYGMLLFFGSMYAALFGLGAAAFKALRTRARSALF